jgi:hypothetical protein
VTRVIVVAVLEMWRESGVERSDRDWLTMDPSEGKFINISKIFHFSLLIPKSPKILFLELAKNLSLALAN